MGFYYVILLCGWIKWNQVTEQRKISHGNPNMIIITNASLPGCRAAFKYIKRGPWWPWWCEQVTLRAEQILSQEHNMINQSREPLNNDMV